MRARVLLTLAIATAASMIAAAVFSPVALGIRTDGYFGTEYAPRPIDDATFMFYMGERIRFKVDFVNSGDVPETIPLGGRDSSQLFASEVTKDGVPAPVRLRFDPVLQIDGPDGVAPVKLGASLTLAPGERLTVNGEVQSIPPEPGVYVIDVSTSLADSSGRPVAPQSTKLDFELRIPGNDRAEVVRRSALQALLDRNFAQADRAASELLRLNAQSVNAFMIRGHIAAARGRSEDSRAMYRRALEILESNDDRQYLLWNGVAGRDDKIAGLRRMIRRGQ